MKIRIKFLLINSDFLSVIMKSLNIFKFYVKTVVKLVISTQINHKKSKHIFCEASLLSD